MAPRIVTHIFDDPDQVPKAVAALERAGFQPSEISVVSRHEGEGTAEEDSATFTGATLGAAAGGGVGVLAGMGIVAIPGIGPLVAAGLLATALAGAVGGSVAGGLVGALIDYGYSDEEARLYSEALQADATLVAVKTVDDMRANAADQILRQLAPVDAAPAARQGAAPQDFPPGQDLQR